MIRRVKHAIRWVAVGAVLAYLFDPERGSARREALRARTLELADRAKGSAASCAPTPTMSSPQSAVPSRPVLRTGDRLLPRPAEHPPRSGQYSRSWSKVCRSATGAKPGVRSQNWC